MSLADSKPLVSIGIPTYNRPEGLKRTLECMLAQTYTNLEIIISDNASPNPEVERIAREYALRDTRISYYRQTENLGAGFNFKFVLEKANGQYFMWAADDDEWSPTCCEELMDIHRNGNYGLVSSYTSCLQPDMTVANLKRIGSCINSNNKEKFFINFLKLHHWNYTKADLIYGIYRIASLRKNTYLFEEADTLIGNDILFILGVIAEDNCFYLDKELRKRHSKYFIKLTPYFRLKRIIAYVAHVHTPYKTQTQFKIENFSRNVDYIINKNFCGYLKLEAKFVNHINHLHLISILG